MTFEDDDGNTETLTSAATAAVEAVTLRLVDRNGDESDDEGRVEIFLNGEWGTVCDDYWTDVEADVVCRIKGNERGSVGNGGRFLGAKVFGEGSGKIWLDDVQCIGTETSLLDCGYRGKPPNARDPVHNCRHREDVGVKCLTGTEPKVKAVVVSPASGDNAYAPGGTLQVTVQWTEAVVVPAGAMPKLWVRDGDSSLVKTWDGRVEYEGGSGTDTLVFEGTLGGKSFNKMKVRPNTLGEPGTIVSAEDPTIAANLKHDDSHLALMTATQIEAPVVVAVPVVEGAPVVGEPVDGAWTAGETVEVQLTFSEPVAVGAARRRLTCGSAHRHRRTTRSTRAARGRTSSCSATPWPRTRVRTTRCWCRATVLR